MLNGLELHHIRANGMEKAGLSLFYRDTGDEYVFVHFQTPAEVWQEDGSWIRVEPGACILAAPHTARGLRTAECDLLHDWFHLQGDISFYLSRYGIECNRVFYPHCSSIITRDIERAELEFVGGSLFSQDTCEMAIGLFFAHLGNALRTAEHTESPYLFRRFAKLRAELMRGDRSVSVNEMAESVGLSPSRFHRLYKGYFGVSPSKDLQKARVEHAKRLLVSPEMRVAEVADLLGYGSVYHFIRQFRGETGMSPGAYRKKHGLGE